MLLLGVVQAQAAGGAAAGSFDLLEQRVLDTAESSVTFSSLSTYAADYQHLQIRAVARTNRPANNDSLLIRFNGDSGSNYSIHHLRGASGSVSSGGFANETKLICREIGGNSGNFGAVVIDILDPFVTTKHKTVRSLGGHATDLVELGSGSYRNTSALTSILLDQAVGSNFLTGSRFSLYGVRTS